MNDTDPAGIDLLVYSDKVAAGVFSSIASIGYVHFGDREWEMGRRGPPSWCLRVH